MLLNSSAEHLDNRSPSVRLAAHPLRTAVEQIVSEHTGHQWTVREATDLSRYACHPSAILSDGHYSVFAKFSEAANGLEQFQIELGGLRLLSERAGVRTPKPIGIAPAAAGNILVLETVQAVDRAPRHWQQIGQTLARIHMAKWDWFGLETQGYFGPLHQDNTPMSVWPAFYAERRLRPGLRLAIESGNIPAAIIQQVERLIIRLPELCGPEPVPSLLHGDAQQNNFISTEVGAVVIDPAVYYGNPEVDLASVGCFQPVPVDVYEGYQDVLPIDPSFWERRDLWRVWGYLAALAVEGSSYLGKLAEAVQKYV